MDDYSVPMHLIKVMRLEIGNHIKLHIQIMSTLL